MKILLAVDGSEYSGMASSMVEALRLRRRTAVTVATVVPEYAFLGERALNILRKSAKLSRAEQQQKANDMVSDVAGMLASAGLAAETLVRWGNPAEAILEAARERDASLIVVGAKGQTDSAKFLLGDVAQKVMRHSKCSVLLVRQRTTTLRRVLLATDGSTHSDRTPQFLLALPLPRRIEVAVLTAYQPTLRRCSERPRWT